MRLHTPYYCACALAIVVYLVAADRRGWSLSQSVARNAFRSGRTPATQHK